MQPIVVRAEKMAAGGDAIAHMPDGRVVFVRGALPDESVAIEVVQSKKDFARAELVEVIEPSEHRAEAPCPAYRAGCGGCTWQHVAGSAQLDLKVAIVSEALRRTGKIADPTVMFGASVPAWEYRTTLRLAAGPHRLGLRRRSSHEIVELVACPVSHPLLQDLLARTTVSGEGEVSLRVAAATGERSAFVADGRVEMSGLPADVGVGPDAAVNEVVDGTPLRVSAASFFQSGPAAAELLVAAVREACGELVDAGTVVDAYGGVGLFAACVGTGSVTLIESSPTACDDAQVNLGGRRARVIRAQVEQWKPRRTDLVIADPSRNGLGRQAIAVLTATRAPRLVLVSCDPVSLARDAGLLRESGYDHVRSTVYDLFPQTHHIETVTTFDRRQT